MKTIREQYNKEFVRVGCTYFKIIEKEDRYGIKRRELKVWIKSEIVQDYGKEILDTIQTYDDFVMIPDNINFLSCKDNCYNLYSKFEHKPKEGTWYWTKVLLEQIFGEQYELGIRYMQILYQYPERASVILAVVSQSRQTGKTTFVNWLDMIFGANMTVIAAQDFNRDFNSMYGTKNLIVIEESMLDKKLTIDKLKALATQKSILINTKFVTEYRLPFFGKIILTSNDEDRFAIIDDDEIRFFVRKLGKPKIINHNIEAELLKEIPAFLYYLNSLSKVNWSVSRSGFTSEELYNESLKDVVEESRSELYKDFKIHMASIFDNNKVDCIYAAPIDIKNRFFQYNNNIQPSYIIKVLKREFKKLPEGHIQYRPFGEGMSKDGRPYLFKKEDFYDSSDIKSKNFVSSSCTLLSEYSYQNSTI
jgi:hypothetical protein